MGRCTSGAWRPGGYDSVIDVIMEPPEYREFASAVPNSTRNTRGVHLQPAAADCPHDVASSLS